ncbi:MAG: SUMF1/EgtB/PvdO family nonheme iron enzyme [Bacteroidales bacterium]|nr:SUMF1/EgtB/PvdO family nonheme iron enzyme [Bacteroidales bacterium]
MYAIEMVYIPQGAFYVGDNVFPGSSSSGYFVAGTTTSPFQITSENTLTIGNSAPTELWGSSTSGYNTIGPTGTLPATCPKGFGAFYIMKYELSQQMYKEFLNKLTRTQQINRVSATTVGRYMRDNNTSTTPQNRNGIKLLLDPGAPYSMIYGNDLNNNNVPDENDDGMHISCNWISFRDYLAFADWAGLRPFTELEYEKACRGPLNPVANEFAWGTVLFINATGINNPGQNNEVPSNSSANVVGNNNINVQGPMRNGCFAGSTTNRVQSGGTFYGVMEMSGNLWEYVVSVGIASNRTFNGHYHGDGFLDVNGNSNTSNWPSDGGIRGAAWNVTTSSSFQISDRVNASYGYTTQRYATTGIRLARTAP